MAEGVPKKTQVPIGIVGMPQPTSHEHKTTIDPVSGNIPPVGDCLGKFRFGFRRQNFVGIENKNPFVAKLQVLECPILFLRPGTIEFELHHFGAVLLGDRDRTIGARGIDHKNFVRPFHAIETARQICRFIFNWNDDGNRNARVHLGRKIRDGFPGAKTWDGTSSVTTEPAPMKASAPTVIFAVGVSGMPGCEESSLPALRLTSGATVARWPSSISPSK